MLPNPSLPEIDPVTAAGILAKRAAFVGKLKQAGLFKQAAGWSDVAGALKNYGQQASSYLSQNPLVPRVKTWLQRMNVKGPANINRIVDQDLLRRAYSDVAGDLKNYGQQASSYLSQNPQLKNDLIGTGIGAAAGGLGGLAVGAKRRSEDEDAPSPWSTALTGAIGGGAIGGGGTAAYQSLAGPEAIGTVSPELAEQKRLSDAVGAVQESPVSHAWDAARDFVIHNVPAEGMAALPFVPRVKTWLQRMNVKGPANINRIVDQDLLRRAYRGVDEKVLNRFGIQATGIPAKAPVPSVDPDMIRPPRPVTGPAERPMPFSGSLPSVEALNAMSPEQATEYMRQARKYPETRSALNQFLEEYMRGGKGGKGEGRAVPRAVGPWSWLPGVEQKAVQTAEQEGPPGGGLKALGLSAAMAGLGMAGEYGGRLWNKLTDAPYYGTTDPTAPSTIQQIGNVHPGWLEAMRQNGEYVPSVSP